MGIMLVYDITNEKSFENIKNWIRNIEEHAGNFFDKIIIKCNSCSEHLFRVSLNVFAFFSSTRRSENDSWQ